MTKKKAKASRPIRAKAATAKTAVTKRLAAPADNGAPTLIVLGYDDEQKPRGARFDHDKPDLVTKAADLMGLRVYRTTSPDVAAIAKKLPVDSDLVVELAGEPQQGAVSTDNDSFPAARGLPRSWDEIGPGHLVIAQESLEYGWWEAIVIDRKDDVFTLRYRDYPNLPRFARHRSAVALMSPPSEDRRPEAQAEQA